VLDSGRNASPYRSISCSRRREDPASATGQPQIVVKESIESNDDDPNLPIELDSSPCDA
jgi:hypothetical protein